MARYKSPRIKEDKQRNLVGTLLIGLVLGLGVVLFLVLINLKPTPPTLPHSTNIATPDEQYDSEIPAYDPTLAALNIYPMNQKAPQRNAEQSQIPILTPTAIATPVPAPETKQNTKHQSADTSSSKENLRNQFDPRNQQHYELALELATEAYAAQSQEYFEWAHALIGSIVIHHGTDISDRAKAALDGQKLKSAKCLWLLAKLLGPNFPSSLAPGALEACEEQDREEFLQILVIKSVQPNASSLWRSFTQQALNRFRLNQGTRVKSLAALILTTEQLNKAISPEQQNILVDQIPEGELIETFQHVAGRESHLSRRLVDLIEKKKLVSFPRNLFFRPFQSEAELFPDLRRTLANSLGNKIDAKLIDLSELIPSTAGAEILLAICASSAEPELLERVFDALANRTIPRPAQDFIKILKYSRSDLRARILPAVCLSPYYPDLPIRKRKQVIQKFNELVNDDKFVQNVLDSDSAELIRDFTLAHGQNFSLHILKRLEKYPDVDVREAARKYLEWYRG